MAQLNVAPIHRSFPGLLLGVFGVLFFLSAFDRGPFGPAPIPGPSWLGAVAGSVFIAGGVALILGRVSTAASALAGLFIVVGLAVVANGIAFGTGAQVCSGTGCIAAFAYGAVVVDAFLLAVVARLAQKIAGGAPNLNLLTKTAKGVLMVVLSPLLLLLFLWTAGRAMVARRKTKTSGS